MPRSNADHEALRLGVARRLSSERRGAVDRGHRRPRRAPRAARPAPRAGREVEPALARLRREPLDQLVLHRADQRREPLVAWPRPRPCLTPRRSILARDGRSLRARPPGGGWTRSRRSRSGCGRATLDELVGQEHVIGPGRALRLAIEADRVPSLVLYGPPGIGQDDARAHRRAARPARSSRSCPPCRRRSGTSARCWRGRASGWARRARRTILFLDEIHRFNKAQQDALLPGGRGGARDADRRDDREPVLRAQLGAALADAGLRARAARPTSSSPRSCAAAAAELGVELAGRRRGAGRAAGRRRRAQRARDPRARGRRRPRAEGARSRSATSRTPRASGRSSTTGAATRTTTPSRPGSSRRGRATCRPRSTTSR